MNLLWGFTEAGEGVAPLAPSCVYVWGADFVDGMQPSGALPHNQGFLSARTESLGHSVQTLISPLLEKDSLDAIAPGEGMFLFQGFIFSLCGPGPLSWYSK